MNSNNNNNDFPEQYKSEEEEQDRLEEIKKQIKLKEEEDKREKIEEWCEKLALVLENITDETWISFQEEIEKIKNKKL